MNNQVILNTIASDVFRKQADYDYISARANYRMRLRQQFLWSAQQAVEKYLKAILLFNGRSSRYYMPPNKYSTWTGASEDHNVLAAEVKNIAGCDLKREFGHHLDLLIAEVKKLLS